MGGGGGGVEAVSKEMHVSGVNCAMKPDCKKVNRKYIPFRRMESVHTKSRGWVCRKRGLIGDLLRAVSKRACSELHGCEDGDRVLT
jgi:hypothetical protein